LGEGDLSAQRCSVLGGMSPASVRLRLPFEQGDPRGNARTGGGLAGTACLVVGTSDCLEFGRLERGTSGDDGLLSFVEFGQLLGSQVVEVAGEVPVGLGLGVVERGLRVGPYP
jgi:hypothetical protein